MNHAAAIGAKPYRGGVFFFNPGALPRGWERAPPHIPWAPPGHVWDTYPNPYKINLIYLVDFSEEGGPTCSGEAAASFFFPTSPLGEGSPSLGGAIGQKVKPLPGP